MALKINMKLSNNFHIQEGSLQHLHGSSWHDNNISIYIDRNQDVTYLEKTSNPFFEVHHGQVFTFCKKNMLNLACIPVHQVWWVLQVLQFGCVYHKPFWFWCFSRLDMQLWWRQLLAKTYTINVMCSFLRHLFIAYWLNDKYRHFNLGPYTCVTLL